MNFSTFTKNLLLAGLTVTTLSAYTVAASANCGRSGQSFQPSEIALSPGVFYGANGIRARVARDGRGFKVKNLTGKNGAYYSFADQGNNCYVGPRGYYILVQSWEKFKWKGVHGVKIMHDKRKNAR
ncbi:MAG: hypothetical protein ABJO57_13030 [Lentilitoribacter sp.]